MSPCHSGGRDLEVPLADGLAPALEEVVEPGPCDRLVSAERDQLKIVRDDLYEARRSAPLDSVSARWSPG